MKIQIIIFTLCMVQVYCAVSTEITTVSGEEQAQGYSCKSGNDKIGLMKDGEVKKQYDSKFCAEANCENGVITTSSCGSISTLPECKLVSDLSKPYPDCCPKMVC